MNSHVAIGADELVGLSPDDVVIFDCRFSLDDKQLGRRSYVQSHIPGAFHLDMEIDLAGPAGEHGGRHPLPDIDEFQQKLRDAGVSSGSLVVCYDEQRIAGAARAWWLLKYFGHGNVLVLDGGLPAWREAGLDLSPDFPEAEPGDIQLEPSPEMLVDVEGVRGRPPGMLVDSREPARFAGMDEPIDPVAGHIPGAVNYCWAEISDNDGLLRSEDFHRERWAGIGPGDDVIVYCGSGVTAAVNLLSMEVAGIRAARLYAGSWSDWISWPENPVAREETPTAP